ncbi:hypothetical protein ASPSYDRAFT_44263 [Aspergillus sydowii CBS 593.65]|uniref:Uncharacterized protein n=1 Tax=Aspergillus sydowii CBS 593.65 TaxID=1036612 RepID=A0A1L9TKA8_9EURO|nr:uncharacterized protein ASPSYDRAFT_44263 [Aspergillus sydowii CBS 593.65]OJJ59866.1 hypothetical protein ASPSYDRAFT_44263 [Aspergillus sydowii CBS 593.65]
MGHQTIKTFYKRAFTTSSLVRTTKLWNLAAGRLQQSPAVQRSNYNRVFSPDGRQMTLGACGKTFKLRNMAAGKLKQTLEEKTSPAGPVVFDSRNGWARYY